MSKTVGIVNKHRLSFQNALQAAIIVLSSNFQLEYYDPEESRPVTDYVLTAKGLIDYGASFEDTPMTFTQLFSMVEFDFLQYLLHQNVAAYCRNMLFKFLESTYEESTNGSVRRRHNITTVIRGDSAEADVEFMVEYLRPVMDSIATRAELLTEGAALLEDAVVIKSNHVFIEYGDRPAFLRGEDEGVHWVVQDRGENGYRLFEAKFVPKDVQLRLSRILDDLLEADPLREKHVYQSLDSVETVMNRADAIFDGQ